MELKMADRNMRTPQMPRQTTPRQTLPRQTGTRSTPNLDRIFSAFILGIFLLIAAGGIGGKLTALTEQIKNTVFADTDSFSTPSELTITDKTYMTEVEAAEYLNLTTEKIVSLINSGEISSYVITPSGYSIAKTALDEWFDNEAYQNEIKNNENNQ
jgi:excisionase family DNA binding protein